jgi:hypothetical protein
MQTIEPKSLRVAAYFNPASKSWVARHKHVTHRPVDNARQAENLYGYGANLVDALDAVMMQARTDFQRVICRIILPSKHSTQIQLDFASIRNI